MPARFPAGGGTGTARDPPPTDNAQQGRTAHEYIPTLTHISLQIRLGHSQHPHPLKHPPLFLSVVPLCLFYSFAGDAEYV